ncbi:hypothetical protein GCM10023194_25060 [Planotetraspora phitsanulokensis]|uniref:Superinfection immunity protein n=1 Tax=Planotetraspora phitsanulokensis TaxID=575192 RepID=A0A8J3UFL4_9ACTN|nr:superinfection immunity protein [Planotetraspora phitsanulokensis]GII43556.1 hypothetical protein Pph01_85590 [Planotetraspora phitsanulokensis]
MDALAGSYVFWISLIVVLVTAYLLPSLIGLLRGVEHLPLLIILNLLGGLTCIGWPAAFLAACMLPKRRLDDLPHGWGGHGLRLSTWSGRGHRPPS